MLKQIEKDMMDALKNKNKAKAGALRLLISKCKNKAIEVGHELTDPEVIKVLQSAAKPVSYTHLTLPTTMWV